MSETSFGIPNDESFDNSYFFGDPDITPPEVQQTLTAFMAHQRLGAHLLAPGIAARQLDAVRFMLGEDGGIDNPTLDDMIAAADSYLDSLAPDNLAAEAALVRFPRDWSESDWSQ